MKKEIVVIPSEAPSLDALVVPCWGKSNFHLIVECLFNPSNFSIDRVILKPKCASTCSSCYGPKVSAFCAKDGIDTVVTGYMGQNSLDILNKANIPVYYLDDINLTVREALERYIQGSCSVLNSGNAPSPGSSCDGSCSGCDGCKD